MMNAVNIAVQEADFDPGAEIAALSESNCEIGAIATFTGLVRKDNKLKSMTLEHYSVFAENEIADHVREAQRRWPLIAVRIIHRCGRLIPGDRIVFVGVASAHRQEAFEAATFLMDYLKTRAPFWKLEERASGSQWVEARATDEESVKRWR